MWVSFSPVTINPVRLAVMISKVNTVPGGDLSVLNQPREITT
jgi:hypothetical protein